MKKYLSEKEIKELEKFVQNETMFEAVKKVLLKVVYSEGTLVPGEPAGDPIKNMVLQRAAMALQKFPDLTDEMLGQQLRADTQALRIVELGFLEGFNEFKPQKVTLPKEIDSR